MRLRFAKPHLWIAAFSALGVLVLAIVDAGRTSPGPLAAAHELDPKLSGRSACAECHGGWRHTMAESCLACHDEIATQLDGQVGLHATLQDVQQCGRCHGEHHGTTFSLVNQRSFALAGVAELASFDHGRVGFAMSGKHLDLECAKCHTNAEAAILPQGTHRYLGLSRDCASCHEDPHKGAMKLACAACHGQADWKALEAPGHERFLPLVGGHATASCADCHAERSPHAFEALGRKRQGRARTCTDCHESPHAAGFVAAAARTARLPVAKSCVVCHRAEDTSFRQDAAALTPEQHAASGFPLDPPHANLACDACHGTAPEDEAEAARAFTARFPGRGAAACAACHEDPHGGQFAPSPGAPTDCLRCHDRERFEPHAFTVERHARTALPLTGAHARIECTACHVAREGGRELAEPDAEHPRVFRGTPSRCEVCHADAHDGFFREHVGAKTLAEAGDCARCHGAESFAKLPGAGFDHGRWTGFPLAGAHEQAHCEACHVPRKRPDAHGRTFGRVADTFGKVKGCVTCHADPHGGSFDGDNIRATLTKVEGRTGCARCHEESSWRALPRGFDHGLWTGYRLDGAHARAACSTCHAPLRPAGADGRTMARALGTTCSDCHADAHAGQFARGGTTDCTRCHRSAESFSELVFRHDVQSRFPLDDAHAKVACSGCHQPAKLADGREVVRYKPLTTQCIDCHGRTEDQMRRARKEDR